MTNDHGGNILAVARSLGMEPGALLDFSASINPLGPASGVREAFCASFDLLRHYPDRGAPLLRAALARLHGLPVETIAVANGSTELIYLLPRFLGRNKALIIAPPFSEYARGLQQAGLGCDYFVLDPRNRFALDLPRLAAQLRQGYDLLVLGNPGNPTGALLPRETLLELLEICSETGVFVLMDEAFMDFCEEGSIKEEMVRREQGVVLRSMTKFYAIPGLRLGYAIGAPALISALTGYQEPWSINTAAQQAGLASLADGGYRERTLACIQEERSFLFARLSALQGVTPFPSTTNFLLVQLETGPGAAELCAGLLASGILVRNCANFVGLDGSFIRIAVRNRGENERLLEKLKLLL